jgi:hypothetical protein
MPDAHAIREVNDALLNVPMPDRLAALMCSIVSDEPRATHAIYDFVAVAGIMARQLPPAQRLLIAWALVEEAQAIGARWN